MKKKNQGGKGKGGNLPILDQLSYKVKEKQICSEHTPQTGTVAGLGKIQYWSLKRVGFLCAEEAVDAQKFL